MNIGPIQIEICEGSRAARLKEAVLASFHEPAPSVEARLGEFTVCDWGRARKWLDISGLVWYFLERLQSLKLQSRVPEPFLLQLRADLAENQVRGAALFNETLAITKALRQWNIECAVLKIPLESVHDSSLCNQMDLEVLIRETDASLVENCLSQLGYSVSAVSGSTWQFKAGVSAASSLRNAYQLRPERSLEVHLLGMRPRNSKSDRLARSQWRSINEHSIPTLSAADMFVFQGEHLFKHLCAGHTRASWVLEYWRQVCARRDDDAFWRDVETIAEDQFDSGVAIGTATLLTSLIFGSFAPRELAQWSMERLPSGICLWLHLYGRRILLSDNPENKPHLLLRKEVDPHSTAEKWARRPLYLPLQFPQRIARAVESEGLPVRIRRYRLQAGVALRRLLFHVREGLGIAFESVRWERRNGGVSQ
jgi:hypothetical protein